MIWGLLINVFDFFGNLGGSFFSLVFGFWKFWNFILNQFSNFLGVCFIKLFDLRPHYIFFRIFGTLRGLLWVCFLVFENFQIEFWIRIPTFGGSVLWNFLIWGFLDDFIYSSGIIFLGPFLATKETLAPLENDPIM